MAVHLLAAGENVVTSDHRSKPAANLISKGLGTVNGLAAVARGADIIVLMVPDTPKVEEVLFAEVGVASGLYKGKLVIDMSTISPIVTKEFPTKTGTLGCDCLDA